MISLRRDSPAPDLLPSSIGKLVPQVRGPVRPNSAVESESISRADLSAAILAPLRAKKFVNPTPIQVPKCRIPVLVVSGPYNRQKTAP